MKAKCWICEEPATTGEHRIKKSDLSAIFGPLRPGQSIYQSNATRLNHRLQSVNSGALKIAKTLCAKCNNQTTQPFDRAWETFSAAVRRRNSLTVGDVIRANRIFKTDSRTRMRELQLLFVKLFGCRIAESSIPIDLASFRNAILNRRFHPGIYLQIGRPLMERLGASVSDIHTWTTPTGTIFRAAWDYELDTVCVRIIYDTVTSPGKVTRKYWHPAHGTGRIQIQNLFPT